MRKFKVNQVYESRSICDYNCIFSFTVVRRTAKSVWLKDKVDGSITRRAVRIYNGNETCSPYGSYSMAPVINA